MNPYNDNTINEVDLWEWLKCDGFPLGDSDKFSLKIEMRVAEIASACALAEGGAASVPKIEAGLSENPFGPGWLWERIKYALERAMRDSDEAKRSLDAFEQLWKGPDGSIQDPKVFFWEYHLDHRRKKPLESPLQGKRDAMLRERVRAVAEMLAPMGDILRVYAGEANPPTKEDQAGFAAFRDAHERWKSGLERFYVHESEWEPKTIRFPIALVMGDTGETPSGSVGVIVRAQLHVIEKQMGHAVPHPMHTLSVAFREDAGGTVNFVLQDDAENFRQQIQQAWVAAKKHTGSKEVDVAYYVPVSRRLIGESAGGAFALAFLKALSRQRYDQRVLVIATINNDGLLDKVIEPTPNKTMAKENAGTGSATDTLMSRKIKGAMKFNRKVAAHEEERKSKPARDVKASSDSKLADEICPIDKIAVVRAQEPVVTTALGLQSGIVVQVLEDL